MSDDGVRREPQRIPSRAAAAWLDRATFLELTVRRGSRWTPRYLLAFGLGVLIYMPLVGIRPNIGTILGGTVGWVILVTAATSYASRQRTQPTGWGWIVGLAFGIWAVLYCSAMAVGLTFFQGRAEYWIPVAVVAAAPFFAAAYKAARS